MHELEYRAALRPQRTPVETGIEDERRSRSLEPWRARGAHLELRRATGNEKRAKAPGKTEPFAGCGVDLNAKAVAGDGDVPALSGS
jgi:hypothetical protein